VVDGLAEGDARQLLESVLTGLTGPLDARVRDRIIADTHGNPLAMLELSRGLTPAQMTGGFGAGTAVPLDGQIEESFGRQLAALPAQTRRLMQLAAADPSGDPLIAPLTTGVVDLTRRTLNWRPEGQYHLLNSAVERAWDFGRGINPPQSLSQLRQILAFDPNLKLLVGHGLFDLATPYFGSKMWLDQLPPYASPARVKFVVYPGGHMFYFRDAARKAFRAEAEALMR